MRYINIETGRGVYFANPDGVANILIAGRDMLLQAQDTVKVRDSALNPFVARSGRDETIQGNQGIDILALNHPQSSIQSGSNLSLISDGNISGNTNFFSGGNLSMHSKQHKWLISGNTANSEQQ